MGSRIALQIDSEYRSQGFALGLPYIVKHPLYAGNQQIQRKITLLNIFRQHTSQFEHYINVKFHAQLAAKFGDAD
jgi:hypothetical protein